MYDKTFYSSSHVVKKGCVALCSVILILLLISAFRRCLAGSLCQVIQRFLCRRRARGDKVVIATVWAKLVSLFEIKLPGLVRPRHWS